MAACNVKSFFISPIYVWLCSIDVDKSWHFRVKRMLAFYDFIFSFSAQMVCLFHPLTTAPAYICRYSFGHNSPAAAAREVFKPSTDSASLLAPSQQKFFCFGFGVLLGVVTSGGVLTFLWPTLPGPGRQSNGPTFWHKIF